MNRGFSLNCNLGSVCCQFDSRLETTGVTLLVATDCNVYYNRPQLTSLHFCKLITDHNHFVKMHELCSKTYRLKVTNLAHKMPSVWNL